MAMKEIEEIRKLAAHRKAVILAHYYCIPEVQDAADFVGDSLGLSQTAASTDAEVIIFCGVHFMAETAKALSPSKKVIPANENAGCPMADMITAEALRKRRDKLPGVPVLTYVNSSIAVKTLSDMCCTSANVVSVLRAMEGDTILMTPDRNLAAYAQTQVPEKKVLFWEGFCPTHHRLKAAEVFILKEKYPRAEVAAHPECRPDVLSLADFVGSTTGILNHCKKSPAKEFIILTEEGVGHPLRKDNPDKIFHFPENYSMVCPNMKKNTLADLRMALETLTPEIEIDEDTRLQALIPIEKMLQVPRG